MDTELQNQQKFQHLPDNYASGPNSNEQPPAATHGAHHYKFKPLPLYEAVPNYAKVSEEAINCCCCIPLRWGAVMLLI